MSTLSKIIQDWYDPETPVFLLDFTLNFLKQGPPNYEVFQSPPDIVCWDIIETHIARLDQIKRQLEPFEITQDPEIKKQHGDLAAEFGEKASKLRHECLSHGFWVSASVPEAYGDHHWRLIIMGFNWMADTFPDECGAM